MRDLMLKSGRFKNIGSDRTNSRINIEIISRELQFSQSVIRYHFRFENYNEKKNNGEATWYPTNEWQMVERFRGTDFASELIGSSYKFARIRASFSRRSIRARSLRYRFMSCIKLASSTTVVHKFARRIGVAELAAEKNPPADKLRAALVR